LTSWLCPSCAGATEALQSDDVGVTARVGEQAGPVTADEDRQVLLLGAVDACPVDLMVVAVVVDRCGRRGDPG
jgi:hypothetical protein